MHNYYQIWPFILLYIIIPWRQLNHSSLLLCQVQNGSSRPRNESTRGAEGSMLEDIQWQIRLWRWHLCLHYSPHVRQQAELAKLRNYNHQGNISLPWPPNFTYAVSLSFPQVLQCGLPPLLREFICFWPEMGFLSELFSPLSSSIRMSSFRLVFFVENNLFKKPRHETSLRSGSSTNSELLGFFLSRGSHRDSCCGAMPKVENIDTYTWDGDVHLRIALTN